MPTVELPIIDQTIVMYRCYVTSHQLNWCEIYIYMWTFREIFLECEYSHEVPDRLVQGKENNLLDVLISCTLCIGSL